MRENDTMDRKTETRKAKAAIARLGIKGARVRHHGGWLRVYLPKIETKHRVLDSRIKGPQDIQELTEEEMGGERIYYSCFSDCQACAESEERRRSVFNAVVEATGRGNLPHGQLNIFE